MKLLQAGTSDDGGFRRARSIAVLKAAARSLWLGSAAFAEAASAQGTF